MKIFLCLICISSFFCSVNAQKPQLASASDSVSYSLGIVFGATVESAGIKSINDQVFMQGINAGLGGKEMLITAEQANMILNKHVTALKEEQAVSNLAEGQKFLDENGKKEGVITLPSGLQYKIIKAGDGKSPVDTSYVTVHYTGTLISGKVFDSSVERGQPAQFPVNGVIPGWSEALKLMKPGANWILYIPPSLAYGEKGTRGIDPNSVLIFDVQLISAE